MEEVTDVDLSTNYLSTTYPCAFLGGDSFYYRSGFSTGRWVNCFAIYDGNDSRMIAHDVDSGNDYQYYNYPAVTKTSFTQWGGVVYGSQLAFHSFTLSSLSWASVSAGPDARVNCTVKDFVLVGNTYESGVNYPSRIWNSAINDPTSWTAGTNLCDYADLVDVGEIVKLFGGEYCTIFGTSAIAIMQYVGGETGWQVDIKEQHRSIIQAQSILKIDDLIYYMSNTGIYVFDGNSSREVAGGKYNIDIDIAKFDGLQNSDTLDRGSEINAAYDSDKKLIYWSTDSRTFYVYSIDYDEVTTMTLDSSGDNQYMSEWACFSGYYKLTGDSGDTYRTKPMFIARHVDGTTQQHKMFKHNITDLTPDLQTGFYELLPNQWATITRIDTIGSGVTSEDIDILAYDDTKTLIDTVTLTETGGSRTRQTGRYFKFRVQSDFTRFEGLKVEFVARGRR